MACSGPFVCLHSLAPESSWCLFFSFPLFTIAPDLSVTSPVQPGRRSNGEVCRNSFIHVWGICRRSQRSDVSLATKAVFFFFSFLFSFFYLLLLPPRCCLWISGFSLHGFAPVNESAGSRKLLGLFVCCVWELVTKLSQISADMRMNSASLLQFKLLHE